VVSTIQRSLAGRVRFRVHETHGQARRGKCASATFTMPQRDRDLAQGTMSEPFDCDDRAYGRASRMVEAAGVEPQGDFL
jgi:hypothetical protein